MVDRRAMSGDEPHETAVVIDRLPLLRLGVARVLESLGISTSDGDDDIREALRSLVADPPDYVVIGLPGEPRVLATARDIRRRHPNTKVVVLLDGVVSSDLPQLLEIGVAAVVLRSAIGRELADAVRSLRKGDRYVAAASTVASLGELKPGQADQATAGRRPTRLEVQPEGAEVVALTRKERAVLLALAQGRTKREIADQLYVTPETVKTHVAHLYSKLGVHTRHEAIKRALALGLLT